MEEACAKLEEEEEVSNIFTVEALAGLRSFHENQQHLQQLLQQEKLVDENEKDGGEEIESMVLENELSEFFPEDWQISQFWYDQETIRTLVKEVKRLVQTLVLSQPGESVHIACLCCPSVFRCCQYLRNVSADLFEYDKRFSAFGESYYFYDFKNPESIEKHVLGRYSIVLLDPPFLAEECLAKMATTVKLLCRPCAKIILCTGTLLEGSAEDLLSLRKTKFKPNHRNNGVCLRNEFGCFVSYQPSGFDFSL